MAVSVSAAPGLGAIGLKDRVFDIIADETMTPREELCDFESFFELGIDDFLSNAISSRIKRNLKIDIPTTAFSRTSTVSDFQTYLQTLTESARSAPQQPSKTLASPLITRHAPRQSRSIKTLSQSSVVEHTNQTAKTRTVRPPKAHSTNSSPTRRPQQPKLSTVPLSVILQGNPKTCRQTVFLFPDGSGSGMSYARFPKLSPDVCLIALNSPFLTTASAATARTTGIPEIASIWVKEIRQRQSHGPYVVGGWSAGGFYAFEAAKQLMMEGEEVSKILLIDSPCRLKYEALPNDVIDYLSENKLFGGSAVTSTPDWLIKHFQFTLAAVSKYAPTPITIEELPQEHQRMRMPDVFNVWSSDGLFATNPEELEKMQDAGIEVDTPITQTLIEGRAIFGPDGWDELFPAKTKVHCAKSSGHHFNMVYAPHCNMLGDFLRDAIGRDDHGRRKGIWN